MNQLTTTTDQHALRDPATFRHMGDVAAFLVESEQLPAHLRGKVEKGKITKSFSVGKQTAIARLILNAAWLYDVDEMAFAQETFVVGGKLDFSGKVYASLANNRGNLVSRLDYEYLGEGDQMRCICSGRFVGEAESREVQTPSFSELREAGGMAWVGCDPQQQMSYWAARNWVRRHCPEVLLGLVSEFSEAEPPFVDATVAEPSNEPENIVKMIGQSNAMTLYLGMIHNAQTVDELHTAAEQIKADESLTGMEKGNIREEYMLRMEHLQQTEGPSWLLDCEAILHESDNPKAIEDAWQRIDQSDEVAPADVKRLGALFQARMKEFVQN